ncbi:MAG: NAD(P)-binding domain-containing protein, partial [Pseudomonadota bacterium]
MSQTHLIIGAGNMGGAILSGWLGPEQLQPENLVILDPTPGSEALRAIDAGALHIQSEQHIPATIHTTLLAIKPQLFASLSAQLASAIPE